MGVAGTRGALGLVAAAGLLAACGATPAGRLARAPVADPPTFVYVTIGRHGLRSRVELRSAATGRLTKRVAAFGESFTDNGLAVSPDRAYVYVTLIGRRHLRIVRIAVANGKPRFVADGEQPAVSPDGGRLAYIATRRRRSQELAVLDLSSGRTRRIDLRRLVGRSADLFNGTVTWLGDGSDVVAIPGQVAYTTTPPPGAADGVCARATCLIVVHVTGRRLRARRVVLRRSPGGVMKFGGDAAFPHSLLLAGGLTRTTVDRVTLHGSRARVSRLVSLPDSMPVAFSPSGARLLYLVGHSPPALWVAGLARGHAAHPHRLLRDARLGGVAW